MEANVYYFPTKGDDPAVELAPLVEAVSSGAEAHGKPQPRHNKARLFILCNGFCSSRILRHSVSLD